MPAIAGAIYPIAAGPGASFWICALNLAPVSSSIPAVGPMMDPEMFRIAQEQISRMPSDQFLRMQQQMMSNPDLIRMASESMKNLRADDLRSAAEQMKNIRPEDMAKMSSRLASASPDELAAMRVHADAQRAYELQGARSLKNQGNQLHGQGKYKEAIEKYSRGKENLQGNLMSEASALRLACSLNLMSCFLKIGEFDKAVTEGTEVLEQDANNLKALYRRGQAYRELGKLELALRDMAKAAQLDADDAHVKEVLRQIREQLEKGENIEEEINQEFGPIIEEIIDNEANALSSAVLDSGDASKGEFSSQLLSEAEQRPSGCPDTAGFSQTIDTLKQNPEMMRSMHSMMSDINPEYIAAMSGGQMTPEMVKMASDMVKHISPEDMQRMLDMMPSQMKDAAHPSAPFSTPSLYRDSLSLRSAPDTAQNLSGESSWGTSSSSFPTVIPKMKEQMQQTMKDPAMKQMIASMLQNMSPESMAAMSEQMGYKLSPEEAEKAQATLANLSPDVLENMMKWAERAQRAVNAAKKGKNLILGRAGLILAIAMLILAVLLHYFGIIGG